MLADNKREQMPTRARAYQDQVRVREFSFETLASYQDWRDQGRRAVRQALRGGHGFFWVTGNHLGTLPVYEELGSRAGSLVVQLDAHLDIYNLTDCTAELSHGNFLLHSAGPLPSIINVGHRELLLRPEYIREYYQGAISAPEVAVQPEKALARVRGAAREAEQVFIDIDCDVFDPAFFPAVVHPLPFGLSPQLVLGFLDAVWSERVVGVALSEFDPDRDRNDQSLSTLLWLVEYLLLKRYEAKVMDKDSSG
jgi:arginase family enzyme